MVNAVFKKDHTVDPEEDCEMAPEGGEEESAEEDVPVEGH